jgi:hypothetical protein
MLAKTAAVLLSLFAASGLTQAPRLNQWKIIGPGGGGTMISPTINAHNPSLVVEHCDMTGGYITLDGGQSWRMFNLRGGVEAFVFDPSKEDVLYAGNAAVWRTGDRGKTWAMVLPRPASGTVEHQLGDHSDYLLTSDDPAYPGGAVTAMAVDPQNGKKLYVAFEVRRKNAGEEALSVITSSADGGLTWKKNASLAGHVSILTSDGGTLTAIAGSSAYRLFDDGRIEKAGEIPGSVKSASAAHAEDSVWFYVTNTEGQLFVSKDAGKAWTLQTPILGQTAGRFEAIAASDHYPQIAYIGFRGLQLPSGSEKLYNGIAKTTNGGSSWKIIFQESTHAAENLKSTWIEERATQNGEDIWFDSPYSLGVGPANPDVVYATDLFRTYRSLDGGLRWQEVNSKRAGDDSWTSTGLDVTTNYGVQFDPFDRKHIFIDSTDIGLFQSKDGGLSWRGSTDGIPELWRNTTYWIAFDTSVKGRIWGAFSGVHDLPRPKMFRTRSPLQYTGGVGVSNDGGLTWRPSGTGMPSTSVTHILLEPDTPVGSRTLYATAFGRGVYKSVDDGKTWTLRNAGIASQEPFAWRLTRGQDGSLYLVVARRNEGKQYTAAGAGALYRSTDRAEHWEHMDLPSGVDGPTGLAIDPRDPRRLYLTAWGREGDRADHDGGVYGSEDGGKTWHVLLNQSQHVYDLTIDPRNPDTLYICGFDAAAFRSSDRGAHWSQIGGFNFKWGHRVIIDEADSSQIYINTYGGGVWHGPAVGDVAHPEEILTTIPIAH